MASAMPPQQQQPPQQQPQAQQQQQQQQIPPQPQQPQQPQLQQQQESEEVVVLADENGSVPQLLRPASQPQPVTPQKQQPIQPQPLLQQLPQLIQKQQQQPQSSPPPQQQQWKTPLQMYLDYDSRDPLFASKLDKYRLVFLDAELEQRYQDHRLRETVGFLRSVTMFVCLLSAAVVIRDLLVIGERHLRLIHFALRLAAVVVGVSFILFSHRGLTRKNFQNGLLYVLLVWGILLAIIRRQDEAYFKCAGASYISIGSLFLKLVLNFFFFSVNSTSAAIVSLCDVLFSVCLLATVPQVDNCNSWYRILRGDVLILLLFPFFAHMSRQQELLVRRKFAKSHFC